jgi:hypothetical protein
LGGRRRDDVRLGVVEREGAAHIVCRRPRIAGRLGQDLAIDAAGRIVAAGYTANGADTEFALMRATNAP